MSGRFAEVGTRKHAQDSFVTPDGQYEFTRMPFGMVNSGATLVRELRKILEEIPGSMKLY